MNRLLFLLFFIAASPAISAQPAQLFIKKGVFKKRVYQEGDRIHLVLASGEHKTGLLTHIEDSLLWINGVDIPVTQVSRVIIDGVKKNHLPDLKTMGLITGGVGLTTLGLSLNNANKPGKAFASAATIGYAPILVRFLGGRFLYALQRKKYRLGKKYHLQVFDLRVPMKKPF